MKCAYCGDRAVHQDHIFSKALRRRFPEWENVTVPACFNCNIIKGTRHFVPPSWELRIPELEALTGAKWAVFAGDPAELRIVLR